jgi:hypothetical protein
MPLYQPAGYGFTTAVAPKPFPYLLAFAAATGGGPNNYGLWYEIVPAGQMATDPAGLGAVIASPNTTQLYQIQIGAGAAGSEVGFGEWVVQNAAGLAVVIPVFPLILIAGNPRIAYRITTGATMSLAFIAYPLPL